MLHRKLVTYSIVVCIALLFMFNCALLPRKPKTVSNPQKESDLIELLNAQQIQQAQLTGTQTEEINNLKQQLTALEKQIKTNQDEINQLRSEIVLKNEKINQLESTLQKQQTVPEKTGAQVTVKEEQGKPMVMVQQTATVAGSTFESEYKAARDAFEARKYKEALQMFNALLPKSQGNILTANCYYWIGECYFALKDYKPAVIAFEKVFMNIKSEKDDDAQFKLGYTYYLMGDPARAKEEFTKLLNNYPDSEYIERAKAYLQKIG
jgi:TolA-binding protein